MLLLQSVQSHVTQQLMVPTQIYVNGNTITINQWQNQHLQDSITNTIDVPNDNEMHRNRLQDSQRNRLQEQMMQNQQLLQQQAHMLDQIRLLMEDEKPDC